MSSIPVAFPLCGRCGVSTSQQAMIRTPGQPDKYYDIGAVSSHTGETIVQFHRGIRRMEMAQVLQALLEKHPTGHIYVAWDTADTHGDDEVEAVVRAAAGRLIMLYLPTDSRLSQSHRDAVVPCSAGNDPL